MTGKLSAAEIEAIRKSLLGTSRSPLYLEPDPGSVCLECGDTSDLHHAILRSPGGGGVAVVLTDDNDEANAQRLILAWNEMPRLLAHLDALTAPADREALGRTLAILLAPFDPRDIPADYWTSLTPARREALSEVASHLYQLGHAAGAASRQAEVDALRAEIAEARNLASRVVSQSDAEHAVERSELQREIARLTAELGTVTDTMHALHGDLATARAEGEAEGRREEREACAQIVESTADYLSAAVASESAASRIRARGSK